MVELRTQEQQLLSAIESLGGKASVEQLIDTCGFPDTAVMRTGLTLQEKNLITIHAQYQNVIKLTAEGEAIREKRLARTQTNPRRGSTRRSSRSQKSGAASGN